MDANLSNLGFVLHDVARLLKKRYAQGARASGLTRSQWPVMAYLARNEVICQSASAELLVVKSITLARIADKLETMGLVERLPHPLDRRIWLLHLTSAARPKLAQVRKLGDITRGEALAGVFEADRAHLLETLQVLIANLTAAYDAPVARQEGAGSA